MNQFSSLFLSLRYTIFIPLFYWKRAKALLSDRIFVICARTWQIFIPTSRREFHGCAFVNAFRNIDREKLSTCRVKVRESHSPVKLNRNDAEWRGNVRTVDRGVCARMSTGEFRNANILRPSLSKLSPRPLLSRGSRDLYTRYVTLYDMPAK